MEPWKEIFVGDKDSRVFRRTAIPGARGEDSAPAGDPYGLRAIQHVGQSGCNLVLRVIASCVSAVIADQKVKSQLVMGAQATVGEWLPQHGVRKGIIFFEMNGTGADAPESGNDASGPEITDLASFQKEAQDWEEYGYRQMLALLKKLPREVNEHALGIRKPGKPVSKPLTLMSSSIFDAESSKDEQKDHTDAAPNREQEAMPGTPEGQEAMPGTPEDPQAKLTLYAIHTAIKSWVDEQQASLAAMQLDFTNNSTESEEALLKTVKELLSDQGGGKKYVEGSGSSGTSGHSVHEWVFAVRKMNYKMSIGVVSTAAPLYCDWFNPLYVNKAWFWQCCSSCWHADSPPKRLPNTSRGFLANGDKIHLQTQERFKEGSRVVVRLDPAAGELSFSLQENGEEKLIGTMEGANGVVGEVYPAVCLHVQGDCVQFAPDPPNPSALGETKDVRQEGDDNAETKSVMMQTEGITTIDEYNRPYHYGHLSTASQLECLLDDSEEVLRPYDHWPGMNQTGWNSKVVQLPARSLMGAKKALRQARAILDGNAKHSVAQIKIGNLPTDATHEEICEFIRNKCGFVPRNLSLKLDRDFLHPRDRERLARTMLNENMTAFATLCDPQQQKDSLKLNSEKFRGLRDLFVSTIGRADSKELQHDGEKIVKLAHRMLSLEHDLRNRTTRLQRDTASSLDAVFHHVSKGDISQAKAALERAHECIKRLPAGDLLEYEQSHIEDSMFDLQQKINRRTMDGLQKVEQERNRLQEDKEARVDKLRSYLAARGERKDILMRDVQSKRHEIQEEHDEILRQLERQNALDVEELRKDYNREMGQDLSKRMKAAEAVVGKMEPWLNFYNVEDILDRFNWLLDTAEYSLRCIDRGEDNYIAAWECVTSARHLMTLPIGFDDRRRLGLDADKALNSLQLKSLKSHWHSLLQAFPERGQLVRSYELLVARLSNIEQQLKNLMRPMREEVFNALQRCTEQLSSFQLTGPERVIEAARSLRTALHKQNKLPKDFTPVDLDIIVKNVNTEAKLQISLTHDLFLQTAQEVNKIAAKPLKDIFISFDCGPPAHAFAHQNVPEDKSSTQSSEAYYMKQTDALGWAVVKKLKKALEAKGWKVHMGEDYPYQRVYQEIESSRPGEKPLGLHTNGLMSRKSGANGVGDYAESLGVRLYISGDVSSWSGKQLQSALARICRKRLETPQTTAPWPLDGGEVWSSPDAKCFVEEGRFEVIRTEYQIENEDGTDKVAYPKYDSSANRIAEAKKIVDRAAAKAKERINAAEGKPYELVFKAHQDAARMKEIAEKQSIQVQNERQDTTIVDIAIKPTQTQADRCSVETLASVIFSAAEDWESMNGASDSKKDENVLKECYWPWPLKNKGSEAIDYDIKTSYQIQESWAVLMLVTKRYMRACQDLEFLAQGKKSKAFCEMRNAVWFKGSKRIIALLLDESEDGCDVGIPAIWRGRMGDMLGDCASFDFSQQSAFDSTMSKLHRHLETKMEMSRQPPSQKKTVESFINIRSKLEKSKEPHPYEDNAYPVNYTKLITGGSTVLSSHEVPSGFVQAIRQPAASLPRPASFVVGQRVTWIHEDDDIPKGSIGQVVDIENMQTNTAQEEEMKKRLKQRIRDSGNIIVKWKNGTFEMNQHALRGSVSTRSQTRAHNIQAQGELATEASLASALELARSLPNFSHGDLVHLKERLREFYASSGGEPSEGELAEIVQLVENLHAVDETVLAQKLWDRVRVMKERMFPESEALNDSEHTSQQGETKNAKGDDEKEGMGEDNVEEHERIEVSENDDNIETNGVDAEPVDASTVVSGNEGSGDGNTTDTNGNSAENREDKENDRSQDEAPQPVAEE